MGLHFTGEVQNTGFELIEKGDYEFILNAEWAKTQAGDLYINCKFEVNKGVEQEHQGRIIFDGIYKNKTTGEYNSSKINGLLAAINGGLNTPVWDFDDYDDLIQFFNGQKIKATIDIQKADANVAGSKDKNIIKYLSYQVSSVSEKNLTSVIETVTTINNSDLPF